MSSQGSIRTFLLLTAVAMLGGCGEESSKDQPAPGPQTSMPEWVSLFDENALLGEPHLVDCVLSEGATARCVALTIPAAPNTISVGPWCPRNVSDGAEVAGIWLESGKVYDVDGEFIKNLATFYDDPSWQLYDESTGKINVTDSKASCEAAARPDVDEAYQNHCVECQISYLEYRKSQTFVIPSEPVSSNTLLPRIGHDGVGVAFSGVRLDAPAPVDDILDAHTLAPFDDCGGHVNMPVGYHVHAVTDCLLEVEAGTEHAPMLGVALDGHAIHARLNANGTEPAGLDSCFGHTVSELGYHYHVGETGSNAILGCHSAQTGCVLDSESTACDASAKQRGGGPGGPHPPSPRE